MRAAIEKFRMPRYREISDVGLYLEQTVKYINGVLAPLGCMEVTASMVSNYVKNGFVPAPVKKQYYADQIAYLRDGRVERCGTRDEILPGLLHSVDDAACRVLTEKMEVNANA